MLGHMKKVNRSGICIVSQLTLLTSIIRIFTPFSLSNVNKNQQHFFHFTKRKSSFTQWVFSASGIIEGVHIAVAFDSDWGPYTLFLALVSRDPAWLLTRELPSHSPRTCSPGHLNTAVGLDSLSTSAREIKNEPRLVLR